MKIILTVESYAPLKNGVQEITQSYAEYLAKRHDVTVITRVVNNTDEVEVLNGVKIIRINVYTKKSIYHGEIDKYRQLISDLCMNADVMINVCTQNAFTDCILKDLSSLPCKKILYLHGIAHFSFPSISRVDIHDVLSWGLNVVRWKSFYKLNQKHFRKYDAIIHLHKDDNSFTMCKMLGIRNEVFENVACDQPEMPGSTDRTAPYIMIANYLHDKNQELAIRGYFRSKSHRGLIFVGSSNSRYLNKLKKLVSKLEVHTDHQGEIVFVVNEPHKTTMARLQKAYAMILSSKSEKYPVVICEAMKAAVPFIATDTGIIRKLPGGLIFKNEFELCEKINWLENNPTKRNLLANECKRYSEENQNLKVNQIRFEKLIKDIVMT